MHSPGVGRTLLAWERHVPGEARLVEPALGAPLGTTAGPIPFRTGVVAHGDRQTSSTHDDSPEPCPTEQDTDGDSSSYRPSPPLDAGHVVRLQPGDSVAGSALPSRTPR